VKILRIAGENLASLAAAFEVDLAGAVLGPAGLFAITGPTGAGKSTLLDALCLALFDRAPRLGGRRDAAKIGRDEITSIAAHDVRSLVRRGATSAWAEVDFEGSDGHGYRARWSVRRARNRVDGRLRDQELTLTSLATGDAFGGTRTETLEAIRARLGLSFDQFRRSALLAQGDFAAFLRADAAERADLLERMTGTEIYGAVSAAAFVRARDLAAAVKACELGHAQIAVLDDDARAAASARSIEATAAAAEAAAGLRAAEAADAWAATAAALGRELTIARALAERTHAAITDADPLRARLARAEAAQAARPAWRARADARREAERAAAAIGAATDAHATAEAARARAEATEGELRDLLGGLVERWPEIRASENRTPARPDLAAIRARLAVAEPALVRDAELAALAADWPRWAAALDREAAASAAVTAAERSVVEQTATVAAAIARAAATDATRAAASEALEAAQQKATAADRRVTVRPDDARRALTAAEHRARATLRLGDTVAIARAAAAAISAAADLEATARAEAAAADRDHAAAGAELARTGAILGEAERSHERTRVAAGLAHERAALVEGEPCPLCGAEAHPWAARGALDALVAEHAARVAELRGQLTAVQQRVAEASAGGRAARDRADQARAAAITARATRDRAAQTWLTDLAALGELALESDPSTAGAEALARDRAATAERDRLRVAATLTAAENSDRDAREAHASALARRNDLDHADRDHADATARATRAEAALRDAHGARDQARAGHADAIAQLAHGLAPIGGWRGDLERDRRAFASALAQRIARWRTHRDELAAALRDLAGEAEQAASRRLTAERAAAAAAAATAAARADADRAAATLATADAALTALLAEAGLAAEAVAEVDHDPELAARARAELADLDRAAAAAAAVLDERTRRIAAHDATRPTEAAPDLIAARAAAIATDEAARTAALAVRLDDDARARAATAAAELARVRAVAAPYEALAAVIGSHDGKAFRTFAQSLTLDALLIGANAHLDQLAPRYQLERVPRSDLELQVVDRDLGDDVRAVQSLSGGESFLVSLALALALSSLSAHDVRVRTLLIDEGFGTLDPDALDIALAVLDALQASGRQVGIISHVAGLAERIGARVAVRPIGGGKSVVQVRAAG
jgi:exonuclease SbcC